MAEEFGPDAELRARRMAYEEAIRRLEGPAAAARRFQPPYRDAGETGPLRDRVEAEYAAAADRVERARGHLERGTKQHPASQYIQILADSNSVTAPELSDWQWLTQNPGLLTARPRTDAERTANARLEFILRRVHEAQRGQDARSPMSWANYRGPMSEEMDAHTVMAAEAYGVDGTPGNSAVLEDLRSPYAHRKLFRSEDGSALPWYDKETGHYPVMAEAAQLGATAYGYGKWFKPILAFNAMSTAHNAAIPAARELASGRVGGVVDVLARSPLGVLNPEYSPGRKDGPYDWRQGVPAEVVSAADALAGTVPWFVATPRFGRPRTPAGARIRQLVDPDALDDLYRAAARRHHPDLGGTTEAMKTLNRLRELGDMRGIARMAQ